MWNPFQFNRIRKSFCRFDNKLFITLLIRLLLPSVYTTIRVYILGTVNQKDVINIIAQLQWVIIILEIIEEGLLQPLYHCFGQSIRNEDLQAKIRSGFFICSIFYAVVCGMSGILSPHLVDIMRVENSMDIPTIILYIRLELYIHIHVSSNEHQCIHFTFRHFSISLQLGTNGVAYSSIAQSFIVFLVTFTASLHSLDMKPWNILSFQSNEFT